MQEELKVSGILILIFLYLSACCQRRSERYFYLDGNNPPALFVRSFALCKWAVSHFYDSFISMKRDRLSPKNDKKSHTT